MRVSVLLGHEMKPFLIEKLSDDTKQKLIEVVRNNLLSDHAIVVFDHFGMVPTSISFQGFCSSPDGSGHSINQVFRIEIDAEKCNIELEDQYVS